MNILCPRVWGKIIISNLIKERFLKILAKYDVTKCEVRYIDFDNPKPYGDIFVNVDDKKLIDELYSLFTLGTSSTNHQDLLIC